MPTRCVVDCGGKFKAIDTDSAIAARARELRAEGRSLREIAAALDAEGHRPRRKRWHVQTLARVMAASVGVQP